MDPAATLKEVCHILRQDLGMARNQEDVIEGQCFRNIVLPHLPMLHAGCTP